MLHGKWRRTASARRRATQQARASSSRRHPAQGSIRDRTTDRTAGTFPKANYAIASVTKTVKTANAIVRLLALLICFERITAASPGCAFTDAASGAGAANCTPLLKVGVAIEIISEIRWSSGGGCLRSILWPSSSSSYALQSRETGYAISSLGVKGRG